MAGDVERVTVLLRSGADVNAAQGDGMTALHWAASRGDLRLARMLIQAGANLDAGTRIGRYTPLHVAAKEAASEVARALIAAGGDPGALTTNSGTTPLHMAAASGSDQIVGDLLAAGAVVDAREGSWGQTPLAFAAANNRAEVIPVLLEAGADPNGASRVVDVEELADGDRAAERRLGDFLKDLKQQEGGGPDWQPTPSQVQAAIEAAREIQRKWPDVPRPEDDEEGGAPANAEGEASDPAEPTDEAVEPDSTADEAEPDTTAVEGAEEEAPRPKSYAQLVGSWGGLTPLAHAARQGHLEATKALLDGGADVNQPFGGDEATPLIMATLNGQFDLAALLLERGADPAAASTAGTTPLFAALERQWAPRASYAHPTDHLRQQTTYLELMNALLEAGADPNVRLSSHLWFMEYTFGVLRGSGIHLEGATPFWRAAYALDTDAMRLLLAHGADPSIPTMKPPERRRRPMADEEEDAEPEEGEAEETKTQPLEEAPAETTESENTGNTQGGPTKANAEGESAHDEEGEPSTPAEEEDIDHSGVPPVAVGGPHIYPIHAASGVGYGQSFAGNAHRYVPDNWLAAVKFLVEEAGATVDVRDANAYTALHHAASRGDVELIRYLAERGADAAVLSRKGQSTADMANGPVQRVPPYPEAIELLVELGAKNNDKCVSC
ncbi:MAG: ankyrin repeat domain-containing protein [Longimicrobiales bacterium]